MLATSQQLSSMTQKIPLCLSNFSVTDNVCYENKYTKHSNNTILCLVYLFSKQTLGLNENKDIYPSPKFTTVDTGECKDYLGSSLLRLAITQYLNNIKTKEKVVIKYLDRQPTQPTTLKRRPDTAARAGCPLAFQSHISRLA